MIDLHTHSLFSDGELVPSELVRRAEHLGYSAIAITDHIDSSNIDLIIPRIAQVATDLNRHQSVTVVPGAEITHVPPDFIGPLVKRARELGAKIVVIHGETIVEPVAKGTNRAGLEAGADILAHPGLLTLEDARLAAEKGVYLEITARSGHSLTNGHVARSAQDTGSRLILNSDAHAVFDLMTEEFARNIAEGAGLPPGSLSNLLFNARQILETKGYPS